MRPFANALLGLGAGASLPAMASAGPINIHQAVPKAGVKSEFSYPKIIVDGQGTDKYDSVVTQTVDAWMTASADRPADGAGTHDGIIRIEGGDARFEKLGEPKIYKISFPYRDPKSSQVANSRVSPVDLCNGRLAKLSGAARQKFLKNGDLFNYPGAWTANGSIVWIILDTKGQFRDPPAHKTFTATAPVGTSIECRPLDRPKVRSKKTTASGGATPRAKKMDPTIKSATLRMEAANVQKVGNQMCPTQLSLYGQVVTIRPFRGSAIILGPGYLSPITSLNFPAAGARTVRAVYPLKWGSGVAGSLAVGGGAAPSSQTVSLRMNVANQDKKVIETASETVTVTCKRVQPQRVGSTGPQRVAPTGERVAAQSAAGIAIRAAADFDVRIRRVDRAGPGGAVQLWAYNAGPDSAEGCTIGARTAQDGDFDKVAIIETIAPRQTLKLAHPLPDDVGEFRIECPAEPESATSNNGWPVKWEGPTELSAE